MDLALLPALAALAAVIVARASRNGARALAAAQAGAVLAFAIGLALAIADGAGWRAIDGLALALILLTSFVAAIVLGFSRRYLRADGDAQGFAMRVSLLIATVLGLVATGNALLFAGAWLASGLLLASLIGHVGGWDAARAARRRALQAFLIGDAALMAALLGLAAHADSLDLETMIAAAPALPPAAAAGVALLVLVAAMARSALPPFSGWLLGSMTAPTPVSALMHAGLVNAGGFLLIRFAPVLEAAPLVQGAAIAAGLAAALWGTGILLVRPDIKRALAGSTVAQMGFMVLSCGMGAYAAALWHLVAHGLFKAWLFLGSGSAIGGRSAPALLPLPALGIAAIALATLAIGLALGMMGLATVAVLPLLLAIATALATLWAVAGMSGGGRLPAALLVGGLLAVHAGGLWLTSALLARPLGEGPAGPLVAAAIAVPFLGVWAWQAARARPLPPPLYVRLLNAGNAR